MMDNGSPRLVFEPDNDNDDYTMVTAYINEEYARVRDEETTQKIDQEITPETTPKTTPKTTHKTREGY